MWLGSRGREKLRSLEVKNIEVKELKEVKNSVVK
jgi:hypothetical protein